MIQCCRACQLVSNLPWPLTVTLSELPDGPLKKLSIDLGNEHLLVVIDYYFRSSEVDIIESISSATIINKLRQIFSVYWLCAAIFFDNGGQFVSDKFKAFLNDNGTEHTVLAMFKLSCKKVQ